MTNKPITWTENEVDLLTENYPVLAKKELEGLFPNRTIKSVIGKAERLGLKKTGELSINSWNDEEVSIIIDCYTEHSKEEMLKLLPNRTWNQIQSKASKLNVRKYSEYKEDRHLWTIEEIKQLVLDRGYKYHGTYFDVFNKRKIIVECDKGIKSHTYFDNFKNGSEAGSYNVTRKKTYPEIKSMVESEGYIINTVSSSYKNTKSEIILFCPNKHEWKTSANNFISGNRCSTCYFERIGKDNLLSLEYVRERFEEKGFLLLGIQEYTGKDCKLNCKCKLHLEDEFTLNLSYEQIVNRSIRCPHCVNDNKINNYENKYNEMTDIFAQKGLNLKTTLNEYMDMRINIRNDFIIFECIAHVGFGEQKIKIKSLNRTLYSGICNCKYCAKEYISGENHYRWNGGVSNLNQFLRGKIQTWKFDSMRKYDFKCFLTNKGSNLVVHHKYPFSEITKDTLNELGYELRNNISEYTEKELNNIVEACLVKHYKHGLGICLHSSVHDLFHEEYSVHNFTSEDFDEFVERYNNGEFKDKLNTQVVIT